MVRWIGRLGVNTECRSRRNKADERLEQPTPLREQMFTELGRGLRCRLVQGFQGYCEPGRQATENQMCRGISGNLMSRTGRGHTC